MLDIRQLEARERAQYWYEHSPELPAIYKDTVGNYFRWLCIMESAGGPYCVLEFEEGYKELGLFTVAIMNPIRITDPDEIALATLAILP